MSDSKMFCSIMSIIPIPKLFEETLIDIRAGILGHMFVLSDCTHEWWHIDGPPRVVQQPIMYTQALLGKCAHLEIDASVGKFALQISDQQRFQFGLLAGVSDNLIGSGEQVYLLE